MPDLICNYVRGGIHLPQLGLWLDSPKAQTGKEKVFVSHAHSDHTARHREVILSAPTAELMRARLGGRRVEHVLPFGEPREFAGAAAQFRLTLKPAGHILGSAMALIEAGGCSLLYTGDFKLRPGALAEPCAPCHAEVLIMETTYGRPEYRFPPERIVMDELIAFCRAALAQNATPLLLSYSLGKSQEVLRGLGEAGLPVMVHGAIHDLTHIYEQFGQSFAPYERFDPAQARGKVLLCPPGAGRAAVLRHLDRVRTAVITGWAMDARCRYRYQADAAFPLSDHADFEDLLEMVRRVAPRKVLTLHGFAADFAGALRRLGFDAWALSEDEQLDLPLPSAVADPG